MPESETIYQQSINQSIKRVSNRQSGIEVLKVIAILMICISHCTQTLESFVDYSSPTVSIRLLLLQLLRFGGQLGNIIFVVCSSWFLIDSKNVKARKAINIALDSQIISIAYYAVFMGASFVLSFSANHSVAYLIESIFPDLYGHVWFIPTYILLYLIHPYLNLIINSLNKKKHLGICIFIAVFYGFFGLINAAPAYSQFMGFMMVYFLVAYVKLYCEKYAQNSRLNLRLYFVFFLLLIIGILIKNFLGLRIEYFKIYPEFNSLVSVLLFPMMLSLFLVFKSFKFKSGMINRLSSYSIFVYCLHENDLVRDVLRPRIVEILIDRFENINWIFCDLILFAVIVSLSFAGAAIYKALIHRLTEKLSILIERIIFEKYDAIFKKFE